MKSKQSLREKQLSSRRLAAEASLHEALHNKPVPPTILQRMRLALDLTLEEGAMLFGTTAHRLTAIEHDQQLEYHPEAQIMAAMYLGYGYAVGKRLALASLAQESGIALS